MKKRILLSGVVVLFVVCAVQNVMYYKSKESYSDYLLENIEALAYNEGDWDQNGWYCWKYSQDDYSSSVFFTYTRCFDCFTSTATSVWEQGQCWHR